MLQARIKTAVKGILFIILVLICVFAVNEWMRPKYYYNETWPSTNTYKDFYRLDKNTVDVLFLGSSHAVSAFNPQVIYDEYGITSYNLGSEQQSILVSYYWLREALKSQQPQVVVLETYTVHKYTDSYVYNEMNCSENAVRKAMDAMKLSPLKAEAARAIQKMDPSQNALSFLFSNIRYHTRWTSLGENDYTEPEMVSHGAIKGYTVLGGQFTGVSDMTFRASEKDTVEAEPMVQVATSYLEKIVRLCEERGIKLVFASIPCGEQLSRYRSVKEYADTHEIPFYDFNEETLYHEIGYNVNEDLYHHPNYSGARKISSYLGRLFLEEYGVSPREDASYVKSSEVYQNKIKNLALLETEDVYTYLDRIQDADYSVFVFAPGDFSAFLDEDIMKGLYDLGFKTDLRYAEEGMHYCAVKDGDTIWEYFSADDLHVSGSIREGRTLYGFHIDTSVMHAPSHAYSMTVGGTECGGKYSGIYIAIYDNDQKNILDKVRIDTSVEEKTLIR